jgi:Leucine-rich repeat (LRR) protein
MYANFNRFVHACNAVVCAQQTLPASIGQCKKLRKLQASFNSITHIPKEIEGCESLELCRYSQQLIHIQFTLRVLHIIVVDIAMHKRKSAVTRSQFKAYNPNGHRCMRMHSCHCYSYMLEAHDTYLALTQDKSLYFFTYRLAANPPLAEVPPELTSLPCIAWLSLAGSLWSPGLGLYDDGRLDLKRTDLRFGKKVRVLLIHFYAHKMHFLADSTGRICEQNSAIW